MYSLQKWPNGLTLIAVYKNSPITAEEVLDELVKKKRKFDLLFSYYFYFLLLYLMYILNQYKLLQYIIFHVPYC